MITSSFPRHRCSRFVALALLAAVGAGLLACGDPGEEGPDRSRLTRFEHLDLKPGPITADETVARRYRRLSPSPDAPWKVEGSRPKYVALEDSPEGTGTHSLRLIRNTSPVVTIPGPIDASAFNSVALKAQLGGTRQLVLTLVQDGRAVPVTYTLQPRIEGELRITQINAPALDRIRGEVQELRLSIVGAPGYVRLDWIDLVRMPSGSFYPDPAGDPAMIELWGDLRSGVGVSTGRPVEERFEVPERAALHFAYALPPRRSGAEQDSLLQLTLTGRTGEPAVHRFELDPDAKMGWREVRLPLAATPGETVEARWEIVGGEDVACALAEVGVFVEREIPRRVLLITSDTHRSDHLGVARRGIEVRTPTLDALSGRGILFEDCLSSTNVTNPSHVALMTATHPRDTGILSNTRRLNENAPTLAEAFQRAGFATWAVVSSKHLGDTVSGLGQGFDRMSVPVNAPMRDGGESIDVLAAWLAEEEGLPLFIWLHLFDAHGPYEPPEEIAREYYPDPWRAFDPARPPLEGLPPRGLTGGLGGLKDLEYPLAMYRGEVTYLDRELERLFGLPGLGQAVIGFTADHGENLGEHGIFYSHTDLYPETIHVPLILSFPGGPSGVRCTKPVGHLDLGRTLLDLTGNAGIEFPGSNLLSALEEEPSGRPRFTLAVQARDASVTEDSWHLILRLSSGEVQSRVDQLEKHAVELYHLSEDPRCLHDLVDVEPARAKRMRRSLIDWLGRAEDRGWQGSTIDDPATLRNLEALGYAGEGEEVPSSAELFDPNCECGWCQRFE